MIRDDGRRYEECAMCGLEWNIAMHQRVADDGYICPKCRARENKNGGENYGKKQRA